MSDAKSFFSECPDSKQVDYLTTFLPGSQRWDDLDEIFLGPYNTDIIPINTLLQSDCTELKL